MVQKSMEKTEPKVTIITATYNLIKNNRKDFFIQNLESVRSQTYGNIEHLIVDGASDDGTVELLEEYRKKGWIKYISEPDNGIYDAFNKGIMLAEGKYINFLNSDDFFNNKNAVKFSVDKLEKTNSDFSYGTASYIDSKNKFVKKFKPKINLRYTIMPFNHQTMFTKTEVLKKEGMFDLKYKSASDWDFIIRICLKDYKFCNINKNIVTFRVVGESAINVETSVSEQEAILKDLCAKYINLSDKEINNIIYYRVLPLKMLKAMNIKNPFIYIANFNFKIIRRKIITFKYIYGEGLEYFKLFDQTIFKKNKK